MFIYTIKYYNIYLLVKIIIVIKYLYNIIIPSDAISVLMCIHYTYYYINIKKII